MAGLFFVRPFPSPQAPRAWPDTLGAVIAGCALFFAPSKAPSVSWEPSRTPGLVHGLGDPVGTLGREGLASNQFVLHLPAFLRLFHLSLELLFSTVPRTGAACQRR
jgi:hypothetical protein